MADLGTIMDALAVQLATQLQPQIQNLQVDGRLIPSPTPPSIDVFPGSPFQEQVAYGRGNNEIYLTVRARVATPDSEGAQDLLLSLMDPNSATSLEQAVDADSTLGGVVQYAVPEPPTDFGAFVDVGGNGALLGCTWRVRVMP